MNLLEAGLCGKADPGYGRCLRDIKGNHRDKFLLGPRASRAHPAFAHSPCHDQRPARATTAAGGTSAIPERRGTKRFPEGEGLMDDALSGQLPAKHQAGRPASSCQGFELL